MSETPEVVKIKLKSGDTPARVLSVLEGFVGKAVYCEVASDFVLITELDFLKRLKEFYGDSIDKLHFVTTKSFFVEILKKQNISVLKAFPEEYKDQETKRVKDFINRVEATKNKPEFVAAEIEEGEAEVLEKSSGKGKLKASFTKRKIENLARERSWRGLLFFLFLALIAGLAGLFFFIAPRAEIIVKPRIDTIETTQNVIIALPGADIPTSEQNLPVVNAILVQTEIAGTETFASTKKEYEVTNATGKITLFNRDDQAKFLVPSRLSTDEGLIFRTQGDVTIPGARDDVPGELVVEVVADSYDEQERPIGDRGNVENGTDFFFPALRPELQELYYAEANLGPMVGGSTLTRYFVGEGDEELTRSIMAESFRVRGIDQLQKEIKKRNQRESAHYILLDRENIVRTELIEYDFPIDIIGQEVNTFEVSATYAVGGIVFDQAQVIDHLQDKIRLNQDDRKKIVDLDESAIDYRLLNTQNLGEANWAKASVSIIGVETVDFEADNLYAREWQDTIKREVVGKDLQQARGILVNHPEVEEVLSLKITPFWNKVVPAILDQIDLRIRY